jgi:hypothetical protein
VERALESGAIECDTQVATLVDSALTAGEERGGQMERVADAHPQIDMEITREGEMEQRRMWDASGDAAPSVEDIRDLVVREEVVHPFFGGVDRKCSNCNVVEAQVINPINLGNEYSALARHMFLPTKEHYSHRAALRKDRDASPTNVIRRTLHSFKSSLHQRHPHSGTHIELRPLVPNTIRGQP